MPKKELLNKISAFGYAHEEGKAMVIVVNKWDVEKDTNTMKKFVDDVRNQFQF